MALKKLPCTAVSLDKVFLLICCACFWARTESARLTVMEAQASGQLRVEVCHWSDGKYKLLNIAASAWTGHAKHIRDCCLSLDAAVCPGQQCGTTQLPWIIDAEAKACTPTCPAGSTLDTSTLRCHAHAQRSALEVDPCASNPCAATKVPNSNEVCYADPAAPLGYSCGCVTGNTWNNGTCVDIDGCSCDPCRLVANSNKTCFDQPAPLTGFTCACDAGRRWDGNTCAVIVRCASNPCQLVANSNKTCYDAQATGFTCACDAGRRWDGTACSDIDDCASNPCQLVANSNKTCFDAQAPLTGFTCACDAGRRWDGTTCADINDCASNPCQLVANSNKTCFDAQAPLTGFTCACDAGRRWDGSACADIDGCSSSPCQLVANSNKTCFDKQAPLTGFTCACDPGRSWNGTACADVNGCAGNNPCTGKVNNVCTDVPAPGTGFKCGCMPGFALDGARCVACVSIVAGVTHNADYTGDNGPADQAMLFYPMSVSADAKGNIFIADTVNNAIRQVNATSNVITTLVRMPYVDFVSVLAAPDGFLYFIDDSSGSLYRRNMATGTVDSIIVASVLSGMAINPVSGAMYVMNGGYNTSSAVYKLTTAGTLAATLAASVPEESWAITFDARGNALIAVPRDNTYDWPGNIIAWDGKSTIASTVWNNGSTEPANGAIATSVRFNGPYSLATDSAGNILVSEAYGHPYGCRVWLVDAVTKALRLVAGTGACGDKLVGSDATKTELSNSAAVAFGPGDRSVLIADAVNHRVLRVMLECAAP